MFPLMKPTSIRYLNALKCKFHYHHIGDILMKVFVVRKATTDAFYCPVILLTCFSDGLV